MTTHATAPTHDGPPPCEMDVLEMQLCRAKARIAELEAIIKRALNRLAEQHVLKDGGTRIGTRNILKRSGIEPDSKPCPRCGLEAK